MSKCSYLKRFHKFPSQVLMLFHSKGDVKYNSAFCVPEFFSAATIIQKILTVLDKRFIFIWV